METAIIDTAIVCAAAGMLILTVAMVGGLAGEVKDGVKDMFGESEP